MNGLNSDDWTSLPDEELKALTNNFSFNQLLQLLRRLKGLCFHAPEFAIQRLNEDPALAASVLHACHLVTALDKVLPEEENSRTGKNVDPVKSAMGLLPLTPDEVAASKSRLAAYVDSLKTVDGLDLFNSRTNN